MTGPITVLGASGFIGRHLVAYLRRLGHDVDCPGRDTDLTARPLGLVFYCIGLTADFRTRPHDTMDAHVGVLSNILRAARFEALTYLSSTRVYDRLDTAQEDGDLRANPANPSDLYNLSKLCGEALCLGHRNPRARVARLSNVLGPGMPAENFVAALLAEARAGHISLGETLASGKDYLAVEDACRALTAMTFADSEMASERLFNVASGRNTCHQEVVSALSALTGCSVSVRPGAKARSFPEISVARLRALLRRQGGVPWPSLSIDEMLRALATDARAGTEPTRLEEVSP